MSEESTSAPAESISMTDGISAASEQASDASNQASSPAVESNSAPEQGYQSAFDSLSEESVIADKPMSDVKKSIAPAVEGSEEPAWFYAPNVPGHGEKPDWFIDSKYNNVMDQAKGYKELQRAAAANKPEDAPEEYSMTISDDFKEGFKVDADDPVMNGFKDLAKKLNIPDEGMNEIVNYLAQTTISESKLSAQKTVDEEKRLFQIEMDELGSNRDEIISEISGWAKSNLNSEDAEVVKALGQTARGVRFLQNISGKMRISSIPTDKAEDPSNQTGDHLTAMMADPRYKTDFKYRNKVTKAYADFYNR